MGQVLCGTWWGVVAHRKGRGTSESERRRNSEVRGHRRPRGSHGRVETAGPRSERGPEAAEVGYQTSWAPVTRWGFRRGSGCRAWPRWVKAECECGTCKCRPRFRMGPGRRLPESVRIPGRVRTVDGVKPCGQERGGLRCLYPERAGRQKSSEEQVKVWMACKGR